MVKAPNPEENVEETQTIIPADPVPKNPDPAAPPPPAEPGPPPARPELQPEALSAYDRETLTLIEAQTKEIETLEEDWTKKNAEAKKAKQLLDSAHERLPKVIKERAAGRGKPVQRTLFDRLPEPVEIRIDNTPPPEADPLEHLWRDFPTIRLSNWGATDTDVAKLAEGVRKKDSPFPLNTMGALADYTANVGGTPGFERRLTDYKGIGTAAATRLDEALTGFWAWYNTRGGREEFARERGLLPAATEQSDASGPEAAGGGDGLDHVQRVGEPGPAGDADPHMLDGPGPNDGPEIPDDIAEVPEDAGEEYSLAGSDEAEGE